MVRHVTVVRPEYRPDRFGNPPITLSDYVVVPRLSLYGWYRIKNLISPEQLLTMAKLANRLEKQKKRKRAA